MGVLPLAIAYFFWQEGAAAFAAGSGLALHAAWGYVYFCGRLVLCSPRRIALWLTLHPERRGALESNHTSRVDLSHHRSRTS